MFSFDELEVLENPEINVDLLINCDIWQDMQNEIRAIDIYDIIDCVCKYFNIKLEFIIYNSRKREIVYPRMLAMFFSKIHTKLSLSKIGETLGNKDHATVLNAIKTIKNLMSTDKDVKKDVMFIEQKILAL